jgi:hypothetical protein
VISFYPWWARRQLRVALTSYDPIPTRLERAVEELRAVTTAVECYGSRLAWLLTPPSVMMLAAFLISPMTSVICLLLNLDYADSSERTVVPVPNQP